MDSFNREVQDGGLRRGGRRRAPGRLVGSLRLSRPLPSEHGRRITPTVPSRPLTTPAAVVARFHLVPAEEDRCLRPCSASSPLIPSSGSDTGIHVVTPENQVASRRNRHFSAMEQPDLLRDFGLLCVQIEVSPLKRRLSASPVPHGELGRHVRKLDCDPETQRSRC